MDERLIADNAREVMRRMAEAFLAAPFIATRQGEIELAPHQVDAASRLLDLSGTFGGAVLADATGLGKTFVAIAVARATGRTLVIAPAALRRMWLESLRRTAVEASVESYESLSRGVPGLRERPELLILDEAHHARNPRTRRYAALAELAWGTRVLLLTATPIHNRGTDLRALLALFLGSRAHTMSEQEWRPLVVRRTASSWPGASGLPDIGAPRWLEVPGDPGTLRAITTLPRAVPAADGSVAHALLLLGLIRAWSSSEAALRATLKRRLQRAASLTAALESGRLPDRRELASSLVVDDAIQLGFPGLVDPDPAPVDVVSLKDALDSHVDGVRAILRSLERADGAGDMARTRLLAEVCDGHAPVPVVAFTQFADTADAVFRGSAHRGGAALVTGRGARIASGTIAVEEIVRGFDAVETRQAPHAAMPLNLLIATDVLSEGLSLRRAGVIVHLDLPWTIARLEQRVGRLRRMGSAHERIQVYAIGPPVGARELLTVVRALQRKARLSSAVTGFEELASSLPLLGNRLNRATSVIGRSPALNAIEELRRELSVWAGGSSDRHLTPEAAAGRPVAIALMSHQAGHRLLAVTGGEVSEDPAIVVSAVRSLSAALRNQPCAEGCVCLRDVLESLRRWLDAQRGRELAREVIDASSPAHATVLRALDALLSNATRSDRLALGRRIANVRRLVCATTGVGAETVLSHLVATGGSETIDLDALERLLASRRPPFERRSENPRVLALLYLPPGDAGIAAFTA